MFTVKHFICSIWVHKFLASKISSISCPGYNGLWRKRIFDLLCFYCFFIKWNIPNHKWKVRFCCNLGKNHTTRANVVVNYVFEVVYLYYYVNYFWYVVELLIVALNLLFSPWYNRMTLNWNVVWIQTIDNTNDYVFDYVFKKITYFVVYNTYSPTTMPALHTTQKITYPYDDMKIL